MRVGLERPRRVADDSMLEGLQWESRKEHGHEHHGYSERKPRRAAIRKRPAASRALLKMPPKKTIAGKKRKHFRLHRLKKRPSRSS